MLSLPPRYPNPPQVSFGKELLLYCSLVVTFHITLANNYTPDRMSIDGEDVPGIKRVTKMLEKVPPTDEWECVPHTDIDVGDESDPQLCCVYVNDIYSYLRENEVCLCTSFPARIHAFLSSLQDRPLIPSYHHIVNILAIFLH